MTGGGPPPAVEESPEDLYENAPFGYLSSEGIDGPILQLNRTFCRWTGYGTEDIAGRRRFSDLLSPAGRIVHATRHVPLLQTAGVADGIALELMRADGSRLPVLMNSVVRRDPGGAPLLTRTALFDATAYRRYEAQLVEARNRAEQSAAEALRSLAAVEAADRAKARFLAAMNHEFRTPIGIITGFAELLLEAAQDGRGVPILDWTRDIAASAAHLLELLEDATRYAKLDQAEQRLDRRPAGLFRTAQAGQRLAAAVLERSQVTVRLDEGEEVMAVFDAGLATEAVACTLRELARQAGMGAKLRLSAFGGPARIELCCPGLVLTPEQITWFWAPLETTTVLHRGLEGAGLGMELARQIAVLHGGDLRIGSDANSGTSVVVSFGPG